jgi:prepilin-type N-terminal cleavage/methylation domain-containing protein
MRRLHPRASRRGMTLVEAIIAMLVLTIGVAGIYNLLGSISGSQHNLRLNSQGLDLYSRIASEIKDSVCDYPAQLAGVPIVPAQAVRDPGLLTENIWIPAVVAQPAGSRIRTIGDFDGDGAPTAAANAVLRVDYRVRSLALVNVNPLTYEIDVRVRQIQGDPVRDAPALENGTWIRVFTVQKVCNARTEDLLTAGWRG